MQKQRLQAWADGGGGGLIQEVSLREEAQRSGLCHVFNKQEGWAQLWQRPLLQQSFQCRSYSAFLAFDDYIWPHMKFPPEPTELCRVCSCGSQAVSVEVMKHFKTFHCCQMLKSTSWSGVNVVFMFSLPGLSVLFPFLLMLVCYQWECHRFALVWYHCGSLVVSTP